MTAQTTADLTPLEIALMDLSRRLGRPVNRVGLHAVFEGVNRPYGIEDGVRAMQHAGFTAQFGPMKLADLDPALCPILLFQNDGTPFTVLAREGSEWRVFDPASGEEAVVSAQTLAEHYGGHALRLLRETRREQERGHWFWSALAEHRWAYVQVLMAAAISNLLGLSTSLFTMVVYDRVLPNDAIDSLIALTAGIGIALFFDFLIKSLRASFINTSGRTADARMARRIYEQILGLRLGHGNMSTGALASSLREFETLRDFFTSATVTAMVDLPFIFVYIFVIYLVGGPLALVAGLAVPVVILIALAVQPLLARLARANESDGHSKQSVLVETIQGLETIKTSGLEPILRERWNATVGHHASHAARARAISQLALNLTGSVQQVAQVLIIFVGVFLVRDGTVSMGALIASVILTGRTLGPLAQIAQVLTRINQSVTAYRSIDNLMNAEVDRPVGRDWLAHDRLTGDVAFDRVTFGYEGPQGNTLEEVSFRVKPGEKVAILGPVGSGKSTLVSLLLGLVSPKAGRILIDGIDLRAVDPGDLRRNIGVQLQDTWLFSGSAKENIAAGSGRYDDAHIHEKARISGADSFLRKHPHGYDLQIAEGGRGLSGGQRQCLSLARALIGDPPVLVLDEPTANMDIQTEERVISALREEVADRTLVLITHRTALLALVDRVIVLENGRVAHDGPKDALLARMKGGRK
ncbi:type I secretion system permease/ATPase [Sagittula sp. S175]|uniref:type I secretion system permease/ATPase n=1 Tax=Sagittula sp. S175 TaxID=3415129 RepID=UPI003C7E9EBC